jgi:hypothetical protein
MAQESFSGSTYARGSFALTIDGSELVRKQRAVLRTKLDRLELSEYEHAGIAWIRETATGRIQPKPFNGFLYLWTGTKKSEQLCWASFGPNSAKDLESLTTELIAATPAGQFASMLDAAILRARTTPVPQTSPGSYLSDGGHLVWIPTLGLSNPI